MSSLLHVPSLSTKHVLIFAQRWEEGTNISKLGAIFRRCGQYLKEEIILDSHNKPSNETRSLTDTRSE